MASSSSYNYPCAACKFLRRKCLPGCIFAPYFPAEDPLKFANVHKIFGASNVSKLLNDLLPHQKEDAVNSLAYEAEARIRDPIYGCVGAISLLHKQVNRLQNEVNAANAALFRYANCNTTLPSVPGFRRQASVSGFSSVQQNQTQRPLNGGGGGFYPSPTSHIYPYIDPLPWNGHKPPN